MEHNPHNMGKNPNWWWQTSCLFQKVLGEGGRGGTRPIFGYWLAADETLTLFRTRNSQNINTQFRTVITGNSGFLFILLIGGNNLKIQQVSLLPASTPGLWGPRVGGGRAGGEAPGSSWVLSVSKGFRQHLHLPFLKNQLYKIS